MTIIAKNGRPKNVARYKLILSYRKKKMSITEIGKILGIKRQGVSYYLRTYGDIS